MKDSTFELLKAIRDRKKFTKANRALAPLTRDGLIHSIYKPGSYIVVDAELTQWGLVILENEEKMRKNAKEDEMPRKTKQSEINKLKSQLRQYRNQFEFFHSPGCPNAKKILIGNCCEGNDKALNWRRLAWAEREVTTHKVCHGECGNLELDSNGICHQTHLVERADDGLGKST